MGEARWRPAANDVDEEWFDEDRTCGNVAGAARVEPEWPVSFQSDRLTVTLTVVGDWATAWVGRAKVGLLVFFRTTIFEVRYLKGCSGCLSRHRTCSELVHRLLSRRQGGSARYKTPSHQ